MCETPNITLPVLKKLKFLFVIERGPLKKTKPKKPQHTTTSCFVKRHISFCKEPPQYLKFFWTKVFAFLGASSSSFSTSTRRCLLHLSWRVYTEMKYPHQQTLRALGPIAWAISLYTLAVRLQKTSKVPWHYYIPVKVNFYVEYSILECGFKPCLLWGFKNRFLSAIFSLTHPVSSNWVRGASLLF